MKRSFLLIAIVPFAMACNSNHSNGQGQADIVETKTNQEVTLPEPDTTASKTKFSKVIGWPEAKTPIAPTGFIVTKYASNIKSPRNIYIAPNGDVLVALANSERSAKDKILGAISGKSKSEQGGDGVATHQFSFLYIFNSSFFKR